MGEDTAGLVSEFQRYAALIEKALDSPLEFIPEAESETAVQIERGIVLPRAMTPGRSDDERLVGRLIELASPDRAAQLKVIDRLGHHRRVHRPLLIYAWLMAFRLRYETLPRAEFGRWDEGLRGWADLLESEIGRITWPAGAMSAAQGAVCAEAAWIALALHVAGKVFIRDVWSDLASDTFGRLTRNQHSAGVFLAASPGDNAELFWYHELSILHAAASYAAQAEDRAVAGAVQRAALFHMNETQPDHATSQPWGLFAFIWDHRTRPLADQLLHAVTLGAIAGSPTAERERPDGVSLILLADALYCLRLFL